MADMLIHNARALTMDPANLRAEAVAVSGGRIVGVGALEDVASRVSPAARRIDAAGATVLPGFIESHIHLFAGAAQLDNLSIAGLHGFDAVAKAVRDHARSHTGDPLVMVEQAVYGQFGEGRPITRLILDEILRDRPLAFYAGDHHTMWGNTAALKIAGLLHGAELAEGNEVVMGDDGLALGELKEFEAFAPLIALTPTGGREALGLQGREPAAPPTPAEREIDAATLRRGLKYLASLGITGFHNMDGNAYQLDLLSGIEQAGGLTSRARIPFRILPGFDLARLEEAVELRRRYDSDWLKADFIKIFMDGVIEARNAFLLDDYGGHPGERGHVYFGQEEFDEICVAADRLGFQIAVHATGDGGVRRVLDGYEAAQRANGRRDSRHRVEHVEMLDPADLPRFAALGVVASMQPTHAIGAYFPVEPSATLIGPARTPTAFAWRGLRDSGAAMAFSSDWPVAPLNPLQGVQAAMTRRRAFPTDPDQRQTLHEALAGFTAGSAHAGFTEQRQGVLKAGADADIVILSCDVEKAAPEALTAVAPVATIAGGRVVFEA